MLMTGQPTQPGFQVNANAQEAKMEATVLRLQRLYELKTPLEKGEFIDYVKCVGNCQDFANCEHVKVLGVYKRQKIGTLVGGNFFQRLLGKVKTYYYNFLTKH
jgi:hypothetical protein